MGIKQLVKRYLNIFIGRDILLYPKINLNHRYLGTNYGGFAVAIDFLSNKKNLICYSLGIGEDISFDLAMINNFSSNVFAFDPTPKSIQWLSKQKLPNEFKVYNYGISSFDGKSEFYLPTNPDYVSGSVMNHKSVNEKEYIEIQCRRLKTIMEKLGHNKIDVLKMDIEGSEFDVIKDVIQSRVDFDQLCVEVHHRFFTDGINKLKSMIAELNTNGYELFYVSDNGEELSFIKKELVK